MKIESLNYENYRELQSLCSGRNTTINPWFEVSYPIFVQHQVNEMADLIPLIAYAYSWMPTIPKINFDLIKDDDFLLQQLKLLQAGEVYNLYDILERMIPAINNSIVAASKVLHFLSPEHAAIIDSRVVRAWRTYINFGNIVFPHSFLKATIKRSIESYVKYNYAMKMWLDDIRMHEKDCTLRDLEFLLYCLGNKKAGIPTTQGKTDEVITNRQNKSKIDHHS